MRLPPWLDFPARVDLHHVVRGVERHAVEVPDEDEPGGGVAEEEVGLAIRIESATPWITHSGGSENRNASVQVKAPLTVYQT